MSYDPPPADGEVIERGTSLGCHSVRRRKLIDVRDTVPGANQRSIMIIVCFSVTFDKHKGQYVDRSNIIKSMQCLPPELTIVQ